MTVGASSSVRVFSDNSSTQKPDSIPFGVIDLWPYTYKGKDGTTRGLFFDTSELILREAGIRENLLRVPIKRMFVEIADQRLSCIVVAGTPKVKKRFRLVEPIGEELVAGVLPHKDITIGSYDDLRKFVIAVPRGVVFEPRFDHDKSLNKISVRDYSHAINLLVRGRVDAVAGSVTTYKMGARSMGHSVDSIFGRPLKFYSTGVWLACGYLKPDEKGTALLRSTVIRLRESGTIRKVFERYE